MNAEITAIIDALAGYDAIRGMSLASKEVVAAQDALESAARSLLMTIPGVSSVDLAWGSMDSLYADVMAPGDGGDAFVGQVRFSGHKAGKRGHESIWSFEPGDDAKSVAMGVAAIAKEVADRLAEWAEAQ